MAERPEIETRPERKDIQSDEENPENYEEKAEERETQGKKSLIFNQEFPQKSSVSPV
ncbi:hypothetical protein [Methanosarcina horonobensis]|uniref:hypothetical protein n=1 Tax=Methanosarcina horonobensis TaxID=418008 RepID=UPI0022B93020|nr:hypothetical protein [Methanosarcina horonobensis]